MKKRNGIILAIVGALVLIIGIVFILVSPSLGYAETYEPLPGISGMRMNKTYVYLAFICGLLGLLGGGTMAAVGGIIAAVAPGDKSALPPG